MRLKSSFVVLISFLLTSLVAWVAYKRKKQFYPAVVYLTNNQSCVAILVFQCVVLLFLLAKISVRLFFGRLQQAEIDNLVSQSWYAFFDMCLVFAFFQDELGTEFLFLFSVLLFVRAFHWLIEERVDYMERTPVINFMFHFRVLTLIFLLAVVDAFHIRQTYLKPTSQGLSVHIALGIEYFVLMLNLFSVTLRYILHSVDSMRQHPWDKKTMYLLYVDIVVGLIRLALYAEFAVLMWTLHPFPLFIVRPIYLSARALKKAIKDVVMSRQAIRYMNTVFNDVTSADLAAFSDTVCIICREEMQIPPASNPQNQHTVLKRLPCSHIFHASCLRSWFQRQQTCPTCRMDIIRQARQQELQGQRQRPRVTGDPAGSARVPTTTATSSPSNSSQETAQTTARPTWIPPYFPTWGPHSPAFISSSQTTSIPPFPPVPPPFFTPPFVGMPIIYPGNLFPSASMPMPEPPTHAPASVPEAQLRASAEARFVALRQINVLLNAAVLQMNAYLNAATSGVSDPTNPWLSFATNNASDPSTAIDTKVLVSTDSACSFVKQANTTTTDSNQPSTSSDSVHDPHVLEVRKRRLVHFANSPDGVELKDDR